MDVIESRKCPKCGYMINREQYQENDPEALSKGYRWQMISKCTDCEQESLLCDWTLLETVTPAVGIYDVGKTADLEGYEFRIVSGKLTGRAIMTPEESKIIRRLINRMEWRESDQW